MGLNENSQGPTAVHPPVALPAPLRKGWNCGRKAMYDQEAGASKCQRLLVPITLPLPKAYPLLLPLLCSFYLVYQHLCPFIQWTAALIRSVTHSFFHSPEDLSRHGLIYDPPPPPHHSAQFFLDPTVHPAR